MASEEKYNNSALNDQGQELFASMPFMKIMVSTMDPKTLATALTLNKAIIKRSLLQTPEYSKQEEFDPKRVLDFISMIAMFSKSGILRFNDIFNNLYTDLDYLLKSCFIELKMAYDIYYNFEANDNEASEMDSDISNYVFDDLVLSLPKK